MGSENCETGGQGKTAAQTWHGGRAMMDQCADSGGEEREGYAWGRLKIRPRAPTSERSSPRDQKCVPQDRSGWRCSGSRASLKLEAAPGGVPVLDLDPFTPIEHIHAAMQLGMGVPEEL